MSNQQIRQSEIFAGEDWTVLYRAFTQINFNAYDPASINQALRDYIQNNYAEDFNDWTENSEFVAMIDLLSYLAGSLAFRTDINARENFLETAQARESVLRLARFLSYNPRRAQSGRGLVKITEVKTTESLVDSFGSNLNNRVIKWNDPDNPDWMEQFTIVLNAALIQTNPFGVPLKTATLGGAITQLYRTTSVFNAQCVYPFDGTINGESARFELVNVDFSTDNGFSERDPNPSTPMHLVYRNDGKGNASTRTGFFMFFKQGSLLQDTLTISSPIENRVVDVDTNSISETDVWVQSIDDDGFITSQWTKVPGIFNENITFNNVSPDIRDIFSVVTRDNDQVSLRFGDGRFGNVPVGHMKIWYRTVNGLQYTIRPRDMENLKVTIPYTDSTGRQQDLTIRFSLQEEISNALASEDIDDIRRRAPQVYGTQNRMVSGEDYNVFPLTSNEIKKLRAVNRVYSGHSRFLDINDPTSTLQDTKIFSNDGILYSEEIQQFVQVPDSANLTSEQILNYKIAPMLADFGVRDWITDQFMKFASVESQQTPDPEDRRFVYVPGQQPGIKWLNGSGGGFSTTGTVTATIPIPTFIFPPFFVLFLTPGAKILFQWNQNPNDATSPLVKRWVQVLSASATGTSDKYSVTIDEQIPDGADLIQIIPAFRSTVDQRPFSNLLDHPNTSETVLIQDFLNQKLGFKLYYVYGMRGVTQFGSTTLPGQWVALSTNQIPSTDDLFTILEATYQGGAWSFKTASNGPSLASIRYVFESVKDVRFHDLKNHKVLDGTSGIENRDRITLVWADQNTQEDVVFDVIGNVYDPDGYPLYQKIIVAPTDSDDDGVVDDPGSFGRVVRPENVVIFEEDTSTPFETLKPSTMMIFQNTNQAHGKLNVGDYFYVIGSGFYQYQGVSTPSILQSNDRQWNGYVVKTGVSNLKFEWKHYAGADVRIDPAVTNIIDVFVLTSEYDYLVRQWIANGAPVADTPEPPTDLDLAITFQDFNQYKMFSDELIWRPVKYKYLFGSSAQNELQAQFKIVRLPNSTLSDGEIRTKVIATINDYFDVNKWEFGETFYFTELAAYIHLQLSTSISSVAIVPKSTTGKFGDLFEIRCNTNEVFISTAQVDDIVIIDSNSMTNLRIQ